MMKRVSFKALTLSLVILTISSYFFITYLPEPMQEARLAAMVYPTRLGYDLFVSVGQEVVAPSGTEAGYTLPLDLSRVENLEGVKAWLNDAALAKLKENGFVVVHGNGMDLAEMYKWFKEAGMPVYISTDSVLYVYHAFFDTILMELEEERFAPYLNTTLKAMVREALRVYNAVPTNTLAKNATLLDLAYLSVAARLLDPGVQPEPMVSSLVDAEETLIEQALRPEASSPIFTYEEDYTQYEPRGHYTASETLKRYFKTLMWLGRMRFEADDPLDPDLARLQTAQALILVYLTVETRVETLGLSAFQVWEKIYLPTSFIVGRSDDLTLYDYLDAINQVYGASLTPTAVDDQEKLLAFQESVLQLDRSLIVNVPWWPDEKPRLAGLRYMGQRFILDGYIHQKLCYPEVVPRTMVKGLDVMAAIGSPRAEALLAEEKARYENYEENLRFLKDYIENLTVTDWTQSLYMGWLYTLKAEVETPEQGCPAYMTTEAWLDKSLNTAMSSWAQLRHDTILYAKQPYAGKVSIPPQQPHPGFVEPMPKVYFRLQVQANATRNGLKTLGLLSEAHEGRLDAFIGLLGGLQRIAVKELKGEGLSEGDKSLIGDYGYQLDGLLRGVTERVKDPRVIADVFTDPNTNQVLEVGTGYFHVIIAVYAVQGKLYTAIGSVMSYYEYTWPQNQRLTDEEWRALLESEEAPVQPEWTESFHA